MSDPNEYKFPFRTNYEFYILMVWLIAALSAFVVPFFYDVPYLIYWMFSLTAVVIGLFQGKYGIEIFIRKSRLKGYPVEFLDPTSDEALKLFNIQDKEVIQHVKSSRK